MPIIQYSFYKIDKFNAIRNKIKDYINNHLSQKDAFFTNIIISEAVTNAFLHANSSNVNLSIKIKENKISILITNNGLGFNGNQKIQEIRNSKKDLFKENLFAEGNRGLLLMEEICDEVIFNQTGNEVLLTKTINAQSSNKTNHIYSLKK